MTIRQYSHLVSCLHDEPAPVGDLGRGTHYSIFRSVQWKAIDGTPLPHGRIHDFAVLWDEDHDERVVRAVEKLHMSNMLWPVAFIGERKGMLTILFEHQAAMPAEDGGYAAALDTLADDVDDRDPWGANVGVYQRDPGNVMKKTNPAGIVDDDDAAVIPYLQTIDTLWKLAGRTPQTEFIYSSS